MAIVNNLIMQIDGQNIVVYPNTVGRAVYINESNGYNLIQALNDIRANAISEWSQILNKPFVSIGSDFRVVDGRLQLNGSLSMEWNDIQNKPHTFNSAWSKISGIPESFPSDWNDIINKPSYFPSNWNIISDKPNYYTAEWNHIINRPENFTATWDDLQNKPDLFPTNWEMVENRPEDFASTWNDVKEKPFEILSLLDFNLNNGELFVNSAKTFNIINSSTFTGNISTDDNNYYAVHSVNFKSSYISNIIEDPSMNVLPYMSNINNYFWYGNGDFINFNGVSAIQDVTKYNPINRTLTSADGSPRPNDKYANPVMYYFNSNMDYLFFNGQNINIYNSSYTFIADSSLYNMEYVNSANYAFANAYIKGKGRFNANIKYDMGISTCFSYYNHMFDNTRLDTTFSVLALYFSPNTQKEYFNNKQSQSLYLNSYLYDNLQFLNQNNGRIAHIFNTSYKIRSLNIYGNNIICNNITVEQFGNNGEDTYLNLLYYNSNFNAIYLWGNANSRYIGININLSSHQQTFASIYINNVAKNIGFINIKTDNYLSRLYINSLGNNIELNLYNVQSRGAFTQWFVLRLDGSNINVYGNLRHLVQNTEVLVGSSSRQPHFYNFSEVFQNVGLNDGRPFRYIAPDKDSTIILNNTFNNSYLQAGGVIGEDIPVNYYFNNIYFYNAFYNCKFIQRASIYNNIINAYYAFAACPNLTNARLPMYKYWDVVSKARNLYGCWSSCPNLTNIDGGGDYTSNVLYPLSSLTNISYAFYGSNLLADVEFNLFVEQNVDASNMFGGSASSYLKNKKIHIIKDSPLDKMSLTNPYFIANNSSLNAEKITILDNGRYFEDYHLYIYNNIEGQTLFFNNYFGRGYDSAYNQDIKNILQNTIIENIIYRKDSSFDNTDSNLLNLGSWITDKNSTDAIAYLNTVSNIIYLTLNPETTKKVCYYEPDALSGVFSHFTSINYKNIKAVDYINFFKVYGVNSFQNYCYLGSWAQNSLITKAINWTLVFDFLSFGPSYNGNIDTYSMYANCRYLTDISKAFDWRMNYIQYMFSNCPNIINQYPTPVNLKANSFYCVFSRCVNLLEPLKIVENHSMLADFGYMYNNCYSLRNGFINSSFNRISYMFENCRNLKNVKLDFSNPNHMIYNAKKYPSYIESYNFITNSNVENFMIKINNQCNIDPFNNNGDKNLNINLFGTTTLIQSCPFLLYTPFIPLKAYVTLNYGCFNNCSNLIVLQGANSLYWNYNNNSEMAGFVSGSWNEVNGMYDVANISRNVVIASIGNGFNFSGQAYANMNNLIMGASPEYYAPSTNVFSYSTYGAFNNCPNLIFGRLPHVENLFWNLGYSNCSNLLTIEVSEERIKRMIKTWREDNSILLSVGANLSWSYHNCYNLVEMRFPREYSNFYSVGNNCYNLRYLQIGDQPYQDKNVYQSFHNCYNLTDLWVGNNLRIIQSSFNNCINLKTIKGMKHIGFISYSFDNCGFESFDITSDRLDNLTYVNYSFSNCNKIINLNFNYRPSAPVEYVFNDCANLKRVNIDMSKYRNYSINDYPESIDTTPFHHSFNNCINLTDVTIKGLDGMQSYSTSLFNYCYNLKNITIESLSNNNQWIELFTFGTASFYMSCDNVERITFKGNFYKNNTLTQILYGLNTYNKQDTNLTIRFESNAIFNFGNNEIGYKFFGSRVKYIEGNLNTLYPLTNISYICGGYVYSDNVCLLEPIPITETNYITNMAYSYSGCSNLRNTVCYNSVINLFGAYSNCVNIITAVCGENVISMGDAYSNCHNLIHSVCGNNVTDMWNTYSNCSNIIDVNIGPNVTSCYACYQNCLNISNNISINSKKLSFAPCFEYRANVNLDIHIYPDSMLYNSLFNATSSTKATSIWTGLLFNSPSPDTANYNTMVQLDSTNNRFYWLQPNIQLNIYYDLED